MKLGTLPRGLVVAAVAAVTVVPLAASTASAAPAAPAAYSVYSSAQPLVWADSSSVPVGDVHVPAVVGKTNPLGVASAYAALSNPDGSGKTMSGQDISGLQCAGYDACKDPFLMIARAGHEGDAAGHSEQSASFTGKDGKFPGNIHAVTDCPGACASQPVHSTGSAAGPAGALPGYVSVGSSSATQDLSMDDKGRLVSTATSELDNVSIGPKNEVHFSRLVTTAQALGAGAENSKDGRADIRIDNFYILDNPVELTRAGLRLANAGPSDQEAYDGAKVLLKKLRDRGIILNLPNFDLQVVKAPDHVTVDVPALSVIFEQSAGPVQAAALSDPVQLGHSTAVVAALDANKHIEVQQDAKGNPVVVTTTAPSAVAPAAPPVSVKPSAPATGSRATENSRGRGASAPEAVGNGKGPAGTSGPGVSSTAPAGSDGGPAATNPSAGPGSSSTTDSAGQAPTDPNSVALGLPHLPDSLGLRGAHSVSRAFGAFIGLGLILPLSRFLIRRLG
ncbi:MAG TPA: hypothetical protein VFE55_15385 [Acidimicrobiia bacterium]|nr:hypothetical protein [Acidimicrobiia bacterium]